MDNKKLNEINYLRNRLIELDKKMLELGSKGSFFSFFVKSILIAVAFLLVSNFFDLPTSGKILIFFTIFMLANFIQTFLINKSRKDELEAIKKEQIKIQAEIFKLSKDFDK